MELYSLKPYNLICSLVPSVTALVRFFNLPEHTAGATLFMLFLNVPEIYLNSIQNRRSESALFLSEVMSSSLVFKALAGGIINIMYPRSTFPPFFIRDSIFNIVGFVPFYITISDNKATIFQGVCCVSVYVVFFIVALIQNNYYSKYYKCKKGYDFFLFIIKFFYFSLNYKDQPS